MKEWLKTEHAFLFYAQNTIYSSLRIKSVDVLLDISAQQWGGPSKLGRTVALARALTQIFLLLKSKHVLIIYTHNTDLQHPIRTHFATTPPSTFVSPPNSVGTCVPLTHAHTHNLLLLKTRHISIFKGEKRGLFSNIAPQ